MTCKDCDRRIVCRYYTQWANVEQIETDRCQYFKNKTEDVVPIEWISVKDRLPETNGKYLVAYYSMQFKRYFLDLLYYDAQNKDEYFYCAENYKQKVDYWMPLPEPPKKPKEEESAE